MELGAAAKFGGKCFSCGKLGHKAADCKAKKTAAPPATRPTYTSKQRAKP